MEYLPNHDKKDLENVLICFNDPFPTLERIDEVLLGGTKFFEKVSKDYSDEGEKFLKIFPKLIDLVKDINTLFPGKGIPTLKTGQNGEVKLTRKQAALIFLLSFFNLIKVQESHEKNNFEVSYILYNPYGAAFHFGLCFLNYLTVIGKWLEENNSHLDEIIIYKRKNIDSTNYFENLPKEELCKIKLINTKTSLFSGDASYCIDFANKYIGGGVLTGGNVQEEILFAVEPEAIVSLFFMEKMGDCDAIGIYSTIQYSDYRGYGFNFTFEGCLIDKDNKNPIIKHNIIAIDAIPASFHFSNDNLMNDINRDIFKAYVGFSFANDEEKIPKTIATGNWGCGVFGGNHELKFIQQWIAASLAKLDRLDYYTFGDKNTLYIEKNLENIKNKFKNVNDLYDALKKVSSYRDKYIKNLLVFQVKNPNMSHDDIK